MTLATTHVVTALIDRPRVTGPVPVGTREDIAWHYASTSAERSELADAVLSTPSRWPDLAAERLVYVWDRPCRSSMVYQEDSDGFGFWANEATPEFPNQGLRLVLDHHHDIGAAHFHGPTRHGEDGVWVARSTTARTAVPPLYYDADSDSAFPANAVMPIEGLRPIVREYVETGLRPECVTWQQFDRI